MALPPVSSRTGIFISHAHVDAELAAALRAWLLATLDVAESSITCTSHPDAGLPAGSSIPDAIHARLDGARALFLLATPASRGKPWVQHECGYATAAKKDGLQLFVLVPSAAALEAVPDPFEQTVAVVLNRGPALQAFARQLRVALAPARPVDETYVTATFDLLASTGEADRDEAQVALAATRVELGHSQQALASARAALASAQQAESMLAAALRRTRMQRTIAAAAAVVAMAVAGGLKWWREPQIIDETRAAVEQALATEVKEALDDASRTSAAAMQQALEQVRGLPFSGLVQDQNGRTVRCTQVSARVAAGVPDTRADCDPSGKFTFRAGELAADIHQPITLAVRLAGATYESSPMTRATAPIAVSIRR